MSKHSHKKSDCPQHSTIATYYRLIKVFARPYWFRIMVGVLAGFVIGGAMATSLRIMDISFNVFETGTIQKKIEAPPPKSPAFTPTEKPAAAMQAPLEQKNLSAIQSTKENKETQKKNALFAKVNKIFKRMGINTVLESDDKLTLPIVGILLFLLFFFFMLQSGGQILNKYFLRWVGSKIVIDLRCALFEKLQSQSLAFFSHHNVGNLISRCINDTQAIENAISVSLSDLFTAPIFILVALQFIIQKTQESNLQKEGLLVLLALPFCILPFYVLSRYLKRYQKKVLEKIATVLSFMQECFSGIQVIKAFHREEYENQRFNHVNNRLFKSIRKSIIANIFVQPIMQLSAIGLASVFVLVCYKYQISFGTLAIIGFAAQQAYRPLKDLAKINASLQKSAAAAERIFDILDTDTSLPEAKNPVVLKTFNHEIKFNHLDFSYTPDKTKILSDINLVIPYGSMIALVGQTGSGKSTMAGLLARFYDPISGNITIDGYDLRELDISHLRQMIGIVSQDTFLFNDTIANNIRYGKLDATDEEVRKAAEQASASEFIEKIPNQYNHIVGERGILLSGGQKQRLAIARAILKNPPILILDEATSALDTVTEQLVQRAINNVMKDRTVMAIAHRLSTIKRADLILVMNDGKIIERGTHQSLYKQNGTYRELCDMQFQQKE